MDAADVVTSAESAEAADGLSERDQQILAFERLWWKYAGAKEQAIREQFAMSGTRYYQVLNALIEQIVISRPIDVAIDLRPFLRDGSGSLREEFSFDGLHLSHNGYQVWRDAIAPIVSELCAQ